jgi:hypothetical protein
MGSGVAGDGASGTVEVTMAGVGEAGCVVGVLKGESTSERHADARSDRRISAAKGFVFCSEGEILFSIGRSLT